MSEQFADVGGGIRLCYETFGDPADPPLLLIMGLATQMVAWHEDFCSKLVDQPQLRVMPIFLKQAPRERDAFIEHTETLFKTIGSSGMQRDDAELREVAGLMYDRGLDPNGSARQLAAIIASGNRTPALRRITAPTVVIHGNADRLVRPSAGRAIAKAIAGSKLVKVEGMGHDLPRAAWDQIIAAIVENARRAGFRRSRAAA